MLEILPRPPAIAMLSDGSKPSDQDKINVQLSEIVAELMGERVRCEKTVQVMSDYPYLTSGLNSRIEGLHIAEIIVRKFIIP